MTSGGEVVALMRQMGDLTKVQGMAKFGIRPAQALGIGVPDLRRLASKLGTSHDLAAELWLSGIHEARILASLVDDFALVTEAQMDSWVADFDSWDLCDQCCGNLFDRTPFVVTKSWEWASRPEEFVRRAGFVLMAEAAVHQKAITDTEFVEFLDVLINGMTDSRNFVKKAVSWSFRQIGKRNAALHHAVIERVDPFVASSDRTSRWIAKDVVKELRSEPVQRRLGLMPS